MCTENAFVEIFNRAVFEQNQFDQPKTHISMSMSAREKVFFFLSNKQPEKALPDCSHRAGSFDISQTIGIFSNSYVFRPAMKPRARTKLFLLPLSAVITSLM